MLIATYEIGGAILEVFDDYYCNMPKEEIDNLQNKFSNTVQNLMQSNLDKDYYDSMMKKGSGVC